MSAPITDAAWKKHAVDENTGLTIALEMRLTCIEIENQLNDLRAQFAEYVQAEDAWRDTLIGRIVTIFASKLDYYA